MMKPTSFRSQSCRQLIGRMQCTKVYGLAQMGGAEGVRKAEQYTLVVGLNRGMMMHAVPRSAS